MSSDSALIETLDVLEMPRNAIRPWILKSRQSYCLNHGGRKYYCELMDLYDEVLALLQMPQEEA